MHEFEFLLELEKLPNFSPVAQFDTVIAKIDLPLTRQF